MSPLTIVERIPIVSSSPGSGSILPFKSSSNKFLINTKLSEVPPNKKFNSQNSLINVRKKIWKLSAGQSQAGKNHNGQLKVNQDCFIHLQNTVGLEDYHFYGVLDGHGVSGHHVSNFIKNYLIKFFDNQKIYSTSNKAINFRKNLADKLINEQQIYEKLKEKNFELIRSTFKNCENDLKNEKFDINLSGSTCVLVFLVGSKVICANVGDSRAIMYTCKIMNDSNSNFI
jgi:serine/threonine protein phosphatase PrpC